MGSKKDIVASGNLTTDCSSVFLARMGKGERGRKKGGQGHKEWRGGGGGVEGKEDIYQLEIGRGGRGETGRREGIV